MLVIVIGLGTVDHEHDYDHEHEGNLGSRLNRDWNQLAGQASCGSRVVFPNFRRLTLAERR